MINLLLTVLLIFLISKVLTRRPVTPTPTTITITTISSNVESPQTRDPSLARIERVAPFVSKVGCLFQANPGTLVNQCTGKSYKTSSQWYLTRPDKAQIILDPSGWTSDLINPTLWWKSTLIDQDEYNQRLNQSALARIDPNCSDVDREPF